MITADGGPFSPERSGSIQLNYIVDMCYSDQYSKRDMKKKVAGMGGIKAYQVAKGIGELAPTLKGNIDAIIMTGGVAYSQKLTDMITEYVGFLAPVVVKPGENELESLAAGALCILNKEEAAEAYAE